MQRTIAGMVGVLGLALLSTAGFAQDVSYDYDRRTDFSRLRTYAWVPGANLKDELNHKRIVDAIDAQLVTKGLTRVDSPDRADVLVSYHTAFGSELEINTVGAGWGGYRLSRSGSARVEEIMTGTLMVVMLDAKSHNLIWRGIATKEIDVDANPEKRDKNINKAAEKLFKEYPPEA